MHGYISGKDLSGIRGTHEGVSRTLDWTTWGMKGMPREWVGFIFWFSGSFVDFDVCCRVEHRKIAEIVIKADTEIESFVQPFVET
jgi:hypothetical protein